MTKPTYDNLLSIINAIKAPSKHHKQNCQAYLDSLVKPVGSLGKLEEIATRLAAIQKTTFPSIDQTATIVMAADNGIISEGIASTPIELTKKVAVCMARGVAGINALSKSVGSDVSVYNVGILGDFEEPNLHNVKIANGTKNFLEDKAMTEEEAIRGIFIGINAVKTHKEKGYDILGTGEMGIGNTTTSSAIIMSILNIPADQAVGKGAGLSDIGLVNKKRVINEGIAKHNLIGSDPLNILASVGGLDIAGLVGVYLGCAYYGLPVMMDGVISSAAALVAYELCPTVKSYMFTSHCTVEPAYAHVMKHLDMSPILQLDMRLGEGTGCPLAFSVLKSACEMVRSIIPFEEIDVRTDYMIDLRDET